jgi:hypothetical protein
MTEAIPVVPLNPIRTLPITPVGEFSANKWADCGECSATCCSKGIRMELTEREATNLQEAGTALTALHEVSRLRWSLKPRKTMYEFQSDCGNLVRSETGIGICAVAGESIRPGICSGFRVGEYGCMTLRLQTEQIDLKQFDRFFSESLGE